MKNEPFDESGYDIDHIVELRSGGSNEVDNLQALCPACHRVKTSRNTVGFVHPVEKHPTFFKEIVINGKSLRILTGPQARS